MLKLRLDQDMRDLSGKITVVAEPGNLAEAIGLADELSLRMNIQRQAGVAIPAEPEPTEEG